MPARIFAYYVAHTGKSLLWTAADMLWLYLLISVRGMNPAKAGLIFLVGLAANAVADLGAGIWLDRARSGVAATAMTALAVSAVAFPLTIVAEPYGFVPVLLAALLFRVAYSFYDVPHNALLSRLSDSPRTAMRLSRGRTIGTGIAGIMVCMLVRTGAVDRQAATMAICALSGAALLLAFAVVPLLLPGASPVAPNRRCGVLPGLPPAFLLASIVGIVALGGLGKALLHLPAAMPHAAYADILLLLTVGRMAAGLVPFLPASAWADRYGLPAAYLASAGMALAIGYSAQAIVVLLLGFVLGITNLLGWAKLPSLVRGAQGYGTYTMAGKLALGASGMAMTALLGEAPLYTLAGFNRVSVIAAIACGVAATLFAVLRCGSAPERRSDFSPA